LLRRKTVGEIWRSTSGLHWNISLTRGLFYRCAKGRKISVRCPPKLGAKDHKIIVHCFPLKGGRIAGGLGDNRIVRSCVLFIRSRASVVKTKKELARKEGEIQFTRGREASAVVITSSLLFIKRTLV